MKCPNCGAETLKTLQTRDALEGYSIRRRKECMACGYRFTTFELLLEKKLILSPKLPEKVNLNVRLWKDEMVNEDSAPA